MSLDQTSLEKPLIETLCYQQVEEDDDEHCCTVDIEDGGLLPSRESSDCSSDTVSSTHAEGHKCPQHNTQTKHMV